MILNKEFNTSIADAFTDGMDLFKKAGSYMIGYWFLLFPILIASSFASEFLNQIPFVGRFLGQIGMNYLLVSLMAGFTIFMNKVYHNSNRDFGDFFQGFPFGLKLLLNSILKMVFAIPFLIIPVVLFASQLDFSNLPTDLSDPREVTKYVQSLFLSGKFWIPIASLVVFMLVYQMLIQFSDTLIIVKGSRVLDALKGSIGAVWSNMVFFLSLFFVLIVLNLVGSLLFIIGLVFTMPYSMCILHVVFQKLFIIQKNRLSEEIENFGASEEF